MNLSSLIDNVGLLGVFVLMIPESACVPIPSEATLMIAGAGVSHGWFSFPLAVLAATGGNLVGSLIAYGIGRRYGAGSRRAPGLFRCERLFARWGSRAVFVARLLPLARTFVSLPAGAARVPLGRFVVLTVAGCAIWSSGLIFAGLMGWQTATHNMLAALAGGVLLVAVARALKRHSGTSSGQRPRHTGSA